MPSSSGQGFFTSPPADLAGVKTLPGNVLSGLEREVAADIPPTEFAARAGATISAASARLILSDMGYNISGSIATPAGVQAALENTGRMSAAEIATFIARTGVSSKCHEKSAS